MTKKSVLVIDDDKTLLDLLVAQVKMAGYTCFCAEDGQSGLEVAFKENPDIIILDVMMPGMDGWEVCRRLREQTTVPIILLTAKGEELDKLRGFHLGIDDYVTKPFSFAELIARIGAVLTRTYRSAVNGSQIASGDLMIDLTQHQVSVEGEEVELTPTEYRLLEMLARNARQTIPTEKLLEEVWGTGYEGQVDQVKHYIWALRQKVEQDPGDPEHIVTVRGFGYRFE